MPRRDNWHADSPYLSIYDSASDSLLAEEDLLSQDCGITGIGSSTCDDEAGLDMVADGESAAFVEIATLRD